MYNDYFGFTETPFSIAPDPRYLFMSERHREALAHLLYGMRIDGGFVLLTGEVGTGKTTVCRCLLEQIPQDCDVAFIVNPQLNTIELLTTICEELHIQVPSVRLGIKVFVDLINFHLLETNARGRKTVLIIDEAQNLSDRALEQLRLLTNLETNQRKLMQIMLLGQPELRQRLAKPNLRQLAQRIVARYHLEPLSRPEVHAYVNHRLGVAGVRHALFADAELDRIHRLSRGTPRLINVICDRALLGAYVQGKPTVDRATLDNAATEVLGTQSEPNSRRVPLRWLTAGAIGMAVAAGGVVAYQILFGRNAQAPDRAAVTLPPVAAAASSDKHDDRPTPAERNVAGAMMAKSTFAPQPIAWPTDKDHWLHEALAVRALFKLWNVDVTPAGIEDACAQALARGVHCLQDSGDVERLRSMNVPAIIGLQPSTGAGFFATLVSLDESRAKLVVGGEAREVSIDALRRAWPGSYTVIWRGPVSLGGRALTVGSRGPDVAWVAQQLARLAGQSTSPGSNQFDAALRQQVLDFQRRHGLDVDGVVGPVTLVRLAQASDVRAPTLSPAKPDH